MNKLESIVPPLELCKLIPAGEFEDSVLVWRDHSCLGYYVSERFAGETSDCRGEQKFDCVGNAGLIVMKATLPAPTLAEIRRELRNLSVNVIDGVITVSCRINPEDTISETARDDNDVTAAALRMWLRIRREAGR